MDIHFVIAIAVINFAAAFLQASTGFGYAILAMSLMPLILPMRFCSAISAVTVVVIGLQMVSILHEKISFRMLILPVACCMLTTNVGMYLLMHCPEHLLRLILAGFILLLDLYFILSGKFQVKIKKTALNGCIFGALTGISTGMFNIVGPFFMVYYLNICDENLQYKANLEMSFLIAGLYSTFLHVMYGNITVEVFPYIATSAAAVIVAGFLGLHLFRRLNRTSICRIVYVALPIMAFMLVR